VDRRVREGRDLEIEAFEEGVDAARDVRVAPVRGANVRAPRHQLHEISEIRGDQGRSGEIRGDRGRSREIEGDQGRSVMKKKRKDLVEGVFAPDVAHVLLAQHGKLHLFTDKTGNEIRADPGQDHRDPGRSARLGTRSARLGARSARLGARSARLGTRSARSARRCACSARTAWQTAPVQDLASGFMVYGLRFRVEGSGLTIQRYISP